LQEVAQSIWNQIAQMPEMQYPALKTLFSLTPEELDEYEEDQAMKLEQEGWPNKVILAYQRMAPLLLEWKAIQTFVYKPENFHLRGALPEILSVDEAVLVADKDYWLTGQEAGQLKKLLQETIAGTKKG
jgi:hypothetical protein